MEMNKIMKGTALTALAAATWFAAGTTDAAAKDATNSININDVFFNLGNGYYYEDEGEFYDATINPYVGADVKGAKEIHIGIGTYNKNKGAVKVSSWDVYDNGDYADLSKLNSTKDNYIAIKTEKSDPIYIKIPAAVKGQTVKYNGATNIVSITNIKGVSDTDYKHYTWEYRTSYGDWQELGNYGKFRDKDTGELKEGDRAILQEYQQQGATLYVRARAKYKADDKGNIIKGLVDTKTTVTDASDKSSDPVKYKLYESGTLAGKESKLNIKKQANGPAVSVDYVNNQVKLPKDVEFRMLADSEYYGADYTTKLEGVSVNSKVDIEKFFPAGKAATSGVLEVRKAAVATGNGKAASKWTLVKIDNPEAWEFKPAKISDFDDNGNMVTTGNAVEVQSTTGGSITIQYQYKNNRTKDYAGKVKVTNSGKFDFQVVIKSSDPAGTDKGVTIKAGANKLIKASKGDKVYVRKAGNKKEKTFAGKYVSVAILNQ